MDHMQLKLTRNVMHCTRFVKFRTYSQMNPNNVSTHYTETWGKEMGTKTPTKTYSTVDQISSIIL